VRDANGMLLRKSADYLLFCVRESKSSDILELIAEMLKLCENFQGMSNFIQSKTYSAVHSADMYNV